MTATINPVRRSRNSLVVALWGMCIGVFASLADPVMGYVLEYGTVSSAGAVLDEVGIVIVGQPLINGVSNGQYSIAVGAADIVRNLAESELMLADYDDLVSCLGGPQVSVSEICDSSDFDNDGHVDLRDFAIIQQRLGP